MMTRAIGSCKQQAAFSQSVFEVLELERRRLLSVDLTGTLNISRLPGTLVPGDAGAITLKLANIGNKTAVGRTSVKVYLSPDAQLNSSDTLLNRESLALSIRAGQFSDVPIHVAVPPGQSPGAYYFLVQIDPSNTIRENNESNNIAISSAKSIVDQFGAVLGRRAVTAVEKDNDGTSVIFSLAGPGTGQAEASPAGLIVSLHGTTNASSLLISSLSRADIASIVSDGPLKSIVAASAFLHGDLFVNGSLGSLTLNGAGSASHFTASSFPATARFGRSTIKTAKDSRFSTEVTPHLTAALAHDTGSSSRDGITSDPTITGSVGNSTALTATFGSSPVAITDKVADGAFALDSAALAAIAGHSLSDGAHTLHLGARGAAGALVAVDVTFTLDTSPPATPTLDLNPSFDSAPAGDHQTAEASVTLDGATDPLAAVTLLETDATTTADSQGNFHFQNVALSLGSNSFTVRATDPAGNSSQFVRTITRANGPLLSARLVHDTGASSTDGITSDPTITGTVDNGSVISARVDSMPNPIDITAKVSAGAFTLNSAALASITGSALADGAHTVHLTATSNNQQSAIDVAFTLDTLPPTPPAFDLDSASDSPPAGDHQTTASTVTLVGTTDPNVSVALLQTSSTVQANSQGNFEFNQIALVSGGNFFTARATDLAGNFTDFSLTITQFTATPPILTASLLHDTGVSPTDSITADSSITGTISSDASLTLSFDNSSTGRDVTSSVSAGVFILSASQLDGLAGGALSDGQHTIHLIAKNSFNATASAGVTFMLDRTAPSLNVNTPTNNAVISVDARVSGSVGDTSDISSLAYAFDVSSSPIALSPTGGAFNSQVDLVNVPNGTHSVTVTATDAAGNVASRQISNDVEVTKVYGIDLGPFTQPGESPGTTVLTEQQLTDRMRPIARIATWVRTYQSSGGFEHIGRIAHSLGLKAAVTADLNGNSAHDTLEIQSLINAVNAGEVDMAIVGNEDFLPVAAPKLSETTLLNDIAEVRNSIPSNSNIPLVYSDTYENLSKHPAIIAAVDAIDANIFGYFENRTVSDSLVRLPTVYRELTSIAGGKPVMFSESNFPSVGTLDSAASGSPQNEATYLEGYESFAQANNVPSFIFEFQDEPWKFAEGDQGPHWGLVDSNGDYKPGVAGIFKGQSDNSLWQGQLLQGAGTPSISFTPVPNQGDTQLKGTVSHVQPGLYKVAVFIYVNGWYTKPYLFQGDVDFENETYIGADGTWMANIRTGSGDANATEIRAYLLPADFALTNVSNQPALPAELSGETFADKTF